MPISHARWLVVLSFAGSLGFAACKDTPKPPPAATCVVHAQCPLGQCVSGACLNATPCGDNNQCDRGARCVAQRCIPACSTDLDCPSGYSCTMDGCAEFPDKATAPAPVLRTAARTPLRAGVSEVDLEVPVGVSQGGFAGRGGLYNTRYAETIFPSSGFFHHLRVKALALDTGNERVVIVAAPLIFITEWLRERVVRMVREATGQDYREHLILTANHSHSGPARFWTIPRGFGSFGLDEHQAEIIERIAKSFKNAIVEAVGKLAPAKLGWAADNQFDPQTKIRSSRRRSTPHGNDNRLFMMRVDDMAGQPVASVVNFGIHGILHEGPFLSSDTAGGIEHKLEESFEAAHGRRVPVLFVQGNGGNISPRCDDLGYPDVPRAEVCGARTVPYASALWTSITTKSDWDMRFALKRIPISYDIIGYRNGQFYDETPIGGYKPFTYGAFQCNINARDMPGTDGNIGCVLPIESTFRAPITTFSKTVLSLLKLDDLVISTQPGEPVMEYGHRVVTELKQMPGVRDAQVFGYSQDHQLYLLFEDEWYFGGTEGNTTIWGYKFGDYVARETNTFAQDFLASRPITSKVNPHDFTGNETPLPVAVTATPEAQVGTVIEALPATLERGLQFTFKVQGGHPAAGSPYVILQREVTGQFVDLANDGTPLQANRTRYDNATYKFVTDYEEDTTGRHVWRFRWEELFDFPVGKYRFKLQLPYWTGTASTKKEVFTTAFDLIPSNRIIVAGGAVSASGVSLRAFFPEGLTELEDRDRFERGVANDIDCDGTPDATMDVRQDYNPSGIRVRSFTSRVRDPFPLRGPLKVTVTKVGGTPQVFQNVTAGADGEATLSYRIGRGPVTASTSHPELIGTSIDRMACVRLAGPLYAVTSGFTYEGAGRYSLQVEDALGNIGSANVIVP